MSGFLLELRSDEPTLAGTPIVVDILDEQLRLVTQQTLVIGQQQHLGVPAGRYGVRILLPSGRMLTASVVAEANATVSLAIDLNQISPHKFMQRTAIFKSTYGGASRSLDEQAYESVWLRLWTHNEGKWRVEGWPKLDAIGEAHAVRYWFPKDRNHRMLQLGGPQTPWTMVSLPANKRLEVTARPTANQDGAGLTVTVATDNNLVEALLGYLSIGALRHASLIDERMEELLRGGLADPAVVVIGGYYLLRVSDLDRLDDWPTHSVNPDNAIGWKSDVAVIRAWQLIREQQEATRPSPARLAIARDKLLEAAEYGAPVYTEGLRLLVAGLKLLDFEAAGEDKPVRDGLAVIRPFAAASDIGQPTTMFTGLSPSQTLPSNVYGLPTSNFGMAFLHDVLLPAKTKSMVADAAEGEYEATSARWLPDIAENQRSISSIVQNRQTRIRRQGGEEAYQRTRGGGVVTMSQLLDSGTHFGHQTRRWNPKMKRFIFTDRNGLYIIDLQQTLTYIDQAYQFVKETVAHGGTILFVGTKKQAQESIADEATRVGMPYVNQRWLGGMLTNFSTVHKRLQRLKELDAMEQTGDFEGRTKKEILMLTREKNKLERTLGGIRDMQKVPSAMWVVDTVKEHLAVSEAIKLGIPVIAILDTNCDPDQVNYPIPGNDDAIRSAALLTKVIASAVAEGLQARAGDESGTDAGAAAEPLAEWERELLASATASAPTAPPWESEFRARSDG